MKPHTTRWPDGTPRSTANAFAWRERQAAGIDSIIAQDYTCCTALYNAWRADQRSGHGKGHALQQGKVLPPRTVRGVPRGGKKVAA